MTLCVGSQYLVEHTVPSTNIGYSGYITRRPPPLAVALHILPTKIPSRSQVPMFCTPYSDLPEITIPEMAIPAYSETFRAESSTWFCVKATSEKILLGNILYPLEGIYSDIYVKICESVFVHWRCNNFLQVLKY